MRTLKTSNGYEFMIDDEYFNVVSKHKWYGLDRNGYIVIQRTGYSHESYIKNRKTKGTVTIKLSRFLLGVTDRKIIVDHIDRNPLNNTISNLRICTQRENARNKSSHKNSTSKYLGVHRLMPDTIDGSKRYRAKITVNKKNIHIGIYDSEESAARMYNHFAKKYFGVYANLNKIEDSKTIIDLQFENV
ncbi:MAG: HNH endonuclease signature motif containing protein [Saprospiraceae bacterium]|nr:HNH endonuclease [Saprospiraceae bacterium]